jgi:hypothetical protein
MKRIIIEEQDNGWSVEDLDGPKKVFQRREETPHADAETVGEIITFLEDLFHVAAVERNELASRGGKGG